MYIFSIEPKVCSINQNQNKNKTKTFSHRIQMRQNPKLNLRHADRDLHLMGLAHVAKNRGREAESDKQTGRAGPQQKVSTAKGATDEQVKRKTIANYGSSQQFVCLFTVTVNPRQHPKPA